jgi:hypothetical protein
MILACRVWSAFSLLLKPIPSLEDEISPAKGTACPWISIRKQAGRGGEGIKVESIWGTSIVDLDIIRFKNRTKKQTIKNLYILVG